MNVVIYAQVSEECKSVCMRVCVFWPLAGLIIVHTFLGGTTFPVPQVTMEIRQETYNKGTEGRMEGMRREGGDASTCTNPEETVIAVDRSTLNVPC